MRPETKVKVKEILAGFPALVQSLNKEALDEAFCNPEMEQLLRELLNEGIVLLENDGTLPLSKKEETAFFGINQCDHFYVGYGSGGDVIANHLISPVLALEARNDIKYNKALMEIYKEYSKNHVPDKGVWGYWSTYYDEMPITVEQIRETKKTSNKAVVFIGRASGEGQDNELIRDQYYLNDEEKQLINDVISVYGSIVLVLNTGNINDFSYIKSLGDKISAVVLEWQGGAEAGHAIIDILYGDANPSAKLTDTVALEYNRYPAQNFGNKEQNIYSEDIYVGYRYFETFDKDAVLYPFGYGLSYTTFTITGVFKDLKTDKIEVKATVKNTGNVFGKEVVQLYMSKPNGKLGQPARELVGYEKTKLLAPGEEEEFTITCDVLVFPSYDDSGITGNKSCYVLEAGEYKFYYGNNVREAKECGSIVLDNLIVVKKVAEECSPFVQFDRMKNDNGRLVYEKTPLRTLNRKEDILANLPKELSADPSNISFTDVMKNPSLLDSFVKSLSIEDLCAICHGEGPMRSSFGIAGNAGMLGGVTEELRRRGVPPVITTDGPSGIRANYHATLFPSGTALACSFNREIAKKLGDLFGKEIAGKTNMILAPGLNIHRNILCGRNFEYYSEDPYLTGCIAVDVINGIQKYGMSACPKHFACNNQELLRNSNNSILSERALRDIYLKGFEMVVKYSNPKSIMTSYNKINGVWSHYNYELVTNILRKEWGYKGLVITDWWMQPCDDPDFIGVKDNAYRVRGQIDVLMPGSRINRNPAIDTTLIDCYKDGKITLAEIERCAKNVLKFILTIEI